MAMTANQAYNQFVVITPDNAANIVCPAGRVVTDAVYVGTVTGAAGTLTGVTQDGNAITLTGVVAGKIYPCQFKRINSTGTDATNLVALFAV